jgi:hypothetical protein
MEHQHHSTAAFLDASQVLDKVWHPGLLFKIRRILPSSPFTLLKSHLNERQFETIIGGENSSLSPSIPVCPKGTLLVLFSKHNVLYTSDLPTFSETTLDTLF